MVRRELIEVACYSFLSRHFHLIARSPGGALSTALAWIESRHAFRDGPLFRGRFRSKPVLNDADLLALVRYVDWNAVSAGLATRPEEVPFGSAFHHARMSGPPWLERETLEAVARDHAGPALDSPASYRTAFGDPLGEAGKTLVARDLAAPTPVAGSFFDIVGEAPRGE